MGKRASAFAVALLLAGAARGADTFAVPKQDYALAIDLSGCEMAEDRAGRTGAGRYLRAHCPKTSVSVSFWIEPAEKPGDSRVCRDTWWRRDSGGVADFEMRELGDLAIVDYAIGDDALKQRNVRAYLAYGDTWIDFHLSRIGSGRGGVEDFDGFSPPSRSSTPTREQRHRAAIARWNCASRAGITCSATTATRRSTTRVSWIERSGPGRSVGRNGASQWTTLRWRMESPETSTRATAVLQYGIAEDPTYPMFYYNLACTHAEQNDLLNSIAMLKKAYALKQNMIAGEHIPDPRADSSFEKYLANDTFQKALREIGV